MKEETWVINIHQSLVKMVGLRAQLL